MELNANSEPSKKLDLISGRFEQLPKSCGTRSMWQFNAELNTTVAATIDRFVCATIWKLYSTGFDSLTVIVTLKECLADIAFVQFFYSFSCKVLPDYAVLNDESKFVQFDCVVSTKTMETDRYRHTHPKQFNQLINRFYFII